MTILKASELPPAGAGRIVLGIDPGKQGAIAVFANDGSLIHICDMPLSTVTVGGKERQRVCARGLKTLIAKIPVGARAYVEQVGPSSSAAGSFTFGRSVGVLDGILECYCIPVCRVSPQKWKPAVGILGADKDVSRARAAELFPLWASDFARKKDDGRAEAALIGYYGICHVA